MSLAVAAEGVIHNLAMELEIDVDACHPAKTAHVRAHHVVNHGTLLALVVGLILDVVQVPRHAVPRHAHQGGDRNTALLENGTA